MKKREQYNYFYVDAFTYQTMHDEALKEMNRVKNKKNDKQRTIVQVSIPKRLFRLLKYYGFKVQSIDWGHTDKNGNTVVSIIYDKVTEFNEYGFAGLKQNGKWGVIDNKRTSYIRAKI